MTILNRQQEIFNKQIEIIAKLTENSLIATGSPEVIKIKNERTKDLDHLYGNYSNELNLLFAAFKDKHPIFLNKLNTAANISGDRFNQQKINDSVSEKLNYIALQEQDQQRKASIYLENANINASVPNKK